MIREILTVHDPRLRVKSKPVAKIDKKVKQIIADLKETLSIQEDPEGVGLAGPQIGKNLRIFVVKPKNEIRVIINPELAKTELKLDVQKKSKSRKKVKKIMEGCLSLPHFYGPLRRVPKIVIKYLNEKGEEKSESFEGIEAQIIQHEIDHLNGILFIDRLLEQKKPLYEYVNGEWEEVELI